MKRKSFLMTLSLLTLALTPLAITAVNETSGRLVASDKTYVETISNTFNYEKMSYETKLHNTLKFKSDGLTKVDGKVGKLAASKTLENVNVIGGLMKMNVKFTGQLTVVYGYNKIAKGETPTYVSKESTLTSGKEFIFDGDKPSFFKLKALEETTIESIELTYDCNEIILDNSNYGTYSEDGAMKELHWNENTKKNVAVLERKDAGNEFKLTLHATRDDKGFYFYGDYLTKEDYCVNPNWWECNNFELRIIGANGLLENRKEVEAGRTSINQFWVSNHVDTGNFTRNYVSEATLLEEQGLYNIKFEMFESYEDCYVTDKEASYGIAIGGNDGGKGFVKTSNWDNNTLAASYKITTDGLVLKTDTCTHEYVDKITKESSILKDGEAVEVCALCNEVKPNSTKVVKEALHNDKRKDRGGWADVSTWTYVARDLVGDFKVETKFNAKGNYADRQAWHSFLPIIQEELGMGKPEGSPFVTRMDWYGWVDPWNSGSKLGRFELTPEFRKIDWALYPGESDPLGSGQYYDVMSNCDVVWTITRTGTEIRNDFVITAVGETMYKGRTYNHFSLVKDVAAEKHISIAMGAEFSEFTFEYAKAI